MTAPPVDRAGHGPSEPTATLLVIAKRPVAGRVKTRLQSRFTPAEAAELAAASLEDTLVAVAAAVATRRVVALDLDADADADTDTDWLPHGFDVVGQGTGGLDERLAAAFEAVLGEGAPGRVDGPALLVGMDTPQLTPDLLAVDWRGLDAVLGPAADGGFWAIGFRRSLPAALIGIPMSTDTTGAEQLARLEALGLRVGLLPVLRDVDTPTDAEAAAALAPASAFARTHARLVRRGHHDLPPVRLLEAAFSGAPVDAVTGSQRRRLNARAWTGEADAVDLAILDRCRQPVLDVGCGPGRMVAALDARGHAVLGIDVSKAAVEATRARGGTALRRRVSDPLPREGHWGTVLLADGNIGIDGDPLALLARAAALVAPGGRVVVEAEAGDHPDVRDVVVLEAADGRRSRPLPWARLGAEALVALAQRAGLDLLERCEAGGRVVLVLVKPAIDASGALARGPAGGEPDRGPAFDLGLDDGLEADVDAAS